MTNTWNKRETLKFYDKLGNTVKSYIVANNDTFLMSLRICLNGWQIQQIFVLPVI